MKEASGQAPMDELELKHIIKDMLYKLKRSYVKKKLFGKIGFVIETEDKLICYIKKEKLKRECYIEDTLDYELEYNGLSGKEQEQAEKYNLDKPIVFILDGVNFSTHSFLNLLIHSDDSEIQIKNCYFGGELNITTSSKCIISNSIIHTSRQYYRHSSIAARDLVINNSQYDTFTEDNDGVSIHCNNSVEINFSTLGSCENSTHIYVSNVKVKNSTIYGRYMQIYSKKLETTKSLLISEDSIEIRADELNDINAKSPSIRWNENYLYVPSAQNTVCLKPLSEIDVERELLIGCLNKIEKQAVTQNKATEEMFLQNLQAKSVGKILRRKP